LSIKWGEEQDAPHSTSERGKEVQVLGTPSKRRGVEVYKRKVKSGKAIVIDGLPEFGRENSGVKGGRKRNNITLKEPSTKGDQKKVGEREHTQEKRSLVGKSNQGGRTGRL